MEKIKYKGFKIKLITGEFADSPLDIQTLPEGFYIQIADRKGETIINDTDSIYGKIDTDCKDGVTFLEVGEECWLNVGEYFFELTSIEEWKSCENPEEQAKKFIKGLAEELYYYHNNEVYGYEVKYKKEVVDSCWGFYGSEWCIQYAKDFIDGYSIESLLELDLPAKVVLK